MRHIAKGKEKRLIIVAANQWQQKIYQQIQPTLQQADWCENVYAVLTTAIQMHQKQESGMICIMVDTLCREEMEVFGCLAELDGLTTVAFSTLELHKKMTQAHMLGADFTTPIHGLNEIIIRNFPTDPHELEAVTEIDDDTIPEQVKPVLTSVPEPVFEERIIPEIIAESTPDLIIPELMNDSKETLAESLAARSAQRRRGPVQQKEQPASHLDAPLISEEELKALLG
jgi:hypothetical protein